MPRAVWRGLAFAKCSDGNAEGGAGGLSVCTGPPALDAVQGATRGQRPGPAAQDGGLGTPGPLPLSESEESPAACQRDLR